MPHQGSLFDLPDEPTIPAQRHSPTSVAAAELIEPKAETLRRRVLDFLRSRGKEGASDEQMQEGIPLAPSTQRPRRIELVNAGLVCNSGRTCKTRTGRNAVVWIAREFLAQ